jgi:hypothetical protein
LRKTAFIGTMTGEIDELLAADLVARLATIDDFPTFTQSR